MNRMQQGDPFPIKDAIVITREEFRSECLNLIHNNGYTKFLEDDESSAEMILADQLRIILLFNELEDLLFGKEEK